MPTRAKKPRIRCRRCARPSTGHPWAGWTTSGATAICFVPARRLAATRLDLADSISTRLISVDGGKQGDLSDTVIVHGSQKYWKSRYFAKLCRAGVRTYGV